MGRGGHKEVKGDKREGKNNVNHSGRVGRRRGRKKRGMWRTNRRVGVGN